MNFTEAVTNLVDITHRPDKSVTAGRALNAAITFACTATDFAQDLEELEYTNLTPADNAGNISLSALPRFRKIQYIKPPSYKRYLTHIEADRIFLEGKQRTDCFYVAGAKILWSVCFPSPTFLIGYFKYPPVLADTDTFWLLDIQPWMLLNKAAATIFASVGDDSSATYHEKLFVQQYNSAAGDLKYGATGF